MLRTINVKLEILQNEVLDGFGRRIYYARVYQDGKIYTLPYDIRSINFLKAICVAERLLSSRQGKNLTVLIYALESVMEQTEYHNLDLLLEDQLNLELG